MRKVLYNSAHYVIELEDNASSIQLVLKYYPMEGYGNRAETWVILDKESMELRCGETRYSWGGTGSKETARIRLTEEEALKFIDEMKSVKTPDDVRSLVALVREIEDRLNKEWEEAFNELYDEIVEAGWIQEKIDKAELIPEDYLKDCLKECAEEYFNE